MNTLIILGAKYLLYVIFIVMIANFRFKPGQFKKTLVRGVLSFALLLIFIKITSSLLYNPRPFISDGTPALFAHGNDNGFPSDHTAMAAFIAAWIWQQNKRLSQILLVAAATLGGFRVLAHVHHGIDVTAGLLVGVLSVLAADQILKLVSKQRKASTK